MAGDIAGIGQLTGGRCRSHSGPSSLGQGPQQCPIETGKDGTRCGFPELSHLKQISPTPKDPASPSPDLGSVQAWSSWSVDTVEQERIKYVVRLIGCPATRLAWYVVYHCMGQIRLYGGSRALNLELQHRYTLPSIHPSPSDLNMSFLTAQPD